MKSSCTFELRWIPRQSYSRTSRRMEEWQGDKWRGATWHHDHKLGAMWVENATWLNSWHPCATWEDGMNVKVTHGNHVSLKWRMKKKRILSNGKCDQFVEENKTEKKKQLVEGRREKREKKEKEKKGKEEEEKGRRTGCSFSIFRRLPDQGVGIVHAPRGRDSLLLWLFFV